MNLIIRNPLNLQNTVPVWLCSGNIALAISNHWLHFIPFKTNAKRTSKLSETLRKYTPIQFLTRVCTKDYKIPGSNVTIEKGTSILIPYFSLHRDEKFYSDPMKFDPSRFDSKNKNGKTVHDMPHLPFGDGPRNCIGLRLGKISVKVGLVSILQQHYVDIDDRHIGKEIKLSPGAFILAAANGVHLKFKARHPNVWIRSTWNIQMEHCRLFSIIKYISHILGALINLKDVFNFAIKNFQIKKMCQIEFNRFRNTQLSTNAFGNYSSSSNCIKYSS